MPITPFIPISIPDANQNAAANIVQWEADNLAAVWQMRQRHWLEFWASDKLLSDIQAQVDLLASNLPTLTGLASLTGQAVAMAMPALYLQSVPEASATVSMNGNTRTITPGATSLMPNVATFNGQPYMKFVTPGWYFTTTTDLVTHPSGMVFSTPVNWWVQNAT